MPEDSTARRVDTSKERSPRRCSELLSRRLASEIAGFPTAERFSRVLTRVPHVSTRYWYQRCCDWTLFPFQRQIGTDILGGVTTYSVKFAGEVKQETSDTQIVAHFEKLVGAMSRRARI
jgi:hypothetical protein